MLAKRYAAPVLAVFIASCLPLPHREHETSHIIGQARSGSRPAGDLPLVLSVTRADTTCSVAFAETATDSTGRFEFLPKRGWTYIVPLVLLHRSFDWSVCIQEGPRRVAIYRGGAYTIGDAPSDSLRCEIADSRQSGRCTGLHGYPLYAR